MPAFCLKEPKAANSSGYIYPGNSALRLPMLIGLSTAIHLLVAFALTSNKPFEKNNDSTFPSTKLSALLKSPTASAQAPANRTDNIPIPVNTFGEIPQLEGRSHQENHFPVIDEKHDKNGQQDHYYSPKELDTKPQPQAEIILEFPEASLGISRASAILVLFIEKDGSVSRIEVEQSNLPKVFEENAINTFKSAKMYPAMKDGVAVRSILKIQVEFEDKNIEKKRRPATSY